MKNHYGFTDEQYSSLKKQNVTEMDLFKCIGKFDPNNSGEPLCIVNLYYYIDSHGDFNAPPKKLKHKLIAKAFFNSLGLTTKQELAIYEYIDDSKQNFKGEEDE